jgi:SAM-dependent methyltransferase
MNRDKELYRQLRDLSWDQLWKVEVPRFDDAASKERLERVAVIRAVGVVFSESGPRDELPLVKKWLRGLLNDSEEKIRRYAVAALPKLGREDADEQELLTLAHKAASDREKQYVAKALGKIGGAETLRHAKALPAETIQRVKASVVRAEAPSAIKLDAEISKFNGIELLLRGRAGLETFVHDEAKSFIRTRKNFRITDTKTALVLLEPIAPFTLAEIFSMRCFGELSFSLGVTHGQTLPAVADLVTSAAAVKLMRTVTDGPIRYRLDFVRKGHQRAAVRELAQLIYVRNPELINGGGDTPWTIGIGSAARSYRVELVPRINPDPRFAYRRRDIPAASHPPLAACMARLAGPREGEIVWDPFCGSGVELIERCLLGGVKKVIGTDLSADAIEIARQNFAAAGIQNVETQFVCADFRSFDPGEVTLIITNPPMGKRVPIPNLRGLIGDLLQSAARVLGPGGRLVFANPVKALAPPPSLKRDFSRLIDFGGFHCHLEKYERR